MEESLLRGLRKGDEVVVTGCGTSETMWGGYAQFARLDAEYVVRLPKGMTLAQSMAVGTAGFTSMQSVMALEAHGLKPGDKPVLVTGRGGGVGSVAVAILAKLGYKVAASTGRPELARLSAIAGSDRNRGSRNARRRSEASARYAENGRRRSTAWAAKRWRIC